MEKRNRDPATEAAIAIFGSREALIAKLNVTTQQVSNWYTDGLPWRRRWQTMSYAYRNGKAIPSCLLWKVGSDETPKQAKELELV